jgi:hypothetical protein
MIFVDTGAWVARFSRRDSDSPEADKIREGTIACIDAIFGTSAPDSVKRKLFDTACWIVSERNGKWTTSYRSQASLKVEKNLLRHEHVIPRLTLWSLVTEKKMPVRDVLMMCEGCVVTKEEHERLHKVVDGHSWDRYVKAEVTVIDMSTKQVVPLQTLMEMSEPFIKLVQDTGKIEGGIV